MVGVGIPLFEPVSDGEDDAPPVAGPSNSGTQRRRDAEGDVSMQDANEQDVAEEAREPYVDSEPDSDPEDPIVASLPVFLTPALSKHLALLQYPQRPPAFHTSYPLLPPSLRPEDSREVDHSRRPARERISARYKPKVGQLELSVPMEVREGKQKQRFNVDRSETLGRGQTDQDLGENGTPKPPPGPGGKNKKEMEDYMKGSEKPLERITLAGEAIPDQTWYACALLRDNEVHLTPLTRTMQMRAHLHYLDRIDALELHNVKRERARANGGDDGSDEDVAQGSGSDEDGKATAADIRAANKKKKESAEKKQKAGENKAVQVKVDSGLEVTATGDVKTSRAAASLFGPAKAAAEEPWIDLPYYESTSPASDEVYEKLYTSRYGKLAMLTQATQYLRL